MSKYKWLVTFIGASVPFYAATSANTLSASPRTIIESTCRKELGESKFGHYGIISPFVNQGQSATIYLVTPLDGRPAYLIKDYKKPATAKEDLKMMALLKKLLEGDISPFKVVDQVELSEAGGLSMPLLEGQSVRDLISKNDTKSRGIIELYVRRLRELMQKAYNAGYYNLRWIDSIPAIFYSDGRTDPTPMPGILFFLDNGSRILVKSDNVIVSDTDHGKTDPLMTIIDPE